MYTVSTKFEFGEFQCDDVSGSLKLENGFTQRLPPQADSIDGEYSVSNMKCSRSADFNDVA